MTLEIIQFIRETVINLTFMIRIVLQMKNTIEQNTFAYASNKQKNNLDRMYVYIIHKRFLTIVIMEIYAAQEFSELQRIFLEFIRFYFDLAFLSFY